MNLVSMMAAFVSCAVLAITGCAASDQDGTESDVAEQQEAVTFDARQAELGRPALTVGAVTAADRKGLTETGARGLERAAKQELGGRQADTGLTFPTAPQASPADLEIKPVGAATTPASAKPAAELGGPGDLEEHTLSNTITPPSHVLPCSPDGVAHGSIPAC